VESTLNHHYRDTIGSVGFKAGWGRGADNSDEPWDDFKFATLKMTVKQGLQQFYKPPPDQAGVSHQWSFLKPLVQLVTVAGERTVQLPFDFAGVTGRVAIITTNVNTPSLVDVSGGARALYAVYPTATGSPERIEFEPIRGTTADRGQRQQFVVWPQPDAAYTLEFTYLIQGEMLSGDRPYAYGGTEHAATILASCLAVFEREVDDIKDGPQEAYWKERLATSISIDRGKLPQVLGYNADRSDKLEAGYGRGRDRRMQGNWPAITYNGAVPD
jgi:hypothetical protein